MSAPAGWYPDPTRRHGERYWAGTHWTEHVRDRGVSGTDPLELVADRTASEASTSYRQQENAATAPAGWYPSPGVADEERYWDGARWTDYTRSTRPSQTVRAPAQPAAPRTNTKAVASLVLALAWVGGLGSLVGIVIGLRARREIQLSSGGQMGWGLATAGVAVGLVGLLLALLMIASFAVLFLLT
ncbi:MAG: DUF2510 domain-containing protein [Actinomycetota bacterium]|nr:DUF2510 domain-containing protein [Actinomycetota bacterium]